MRVNVYSEEITPAFQIIRKPEPGPSGRLFLGVRFFLHSSEQLHNTAEDDDRSAVTFWVPWNKKTENEDGKKLLATLFENAAARLRTFKDF